MKKIIWRIFFISILTLAACTSQPVTITPRFDELNASLATPTTDSVSTGLIHSGGVVASAKVIPAQDTQISFLVSAPVQDVLVKEGDLVKAGQTLITLYSPDLELSVKAAELAVESANLEYQYWIPRLDRPPERREQAKAELDGVKAKLETANAVYAQTSLLAPFDGTVVEIKIQPGEFAQAGEVVIILGDVAHMQIQTTDLSERDIPAVEIGQSVNIYIDALDVTVIGKVIRISPSAAAVGGDVVYPVRIELDEQPEGLLWGMTAEVEIQTE